LIHETARALRFNDLNEPALPLCRKALEMAGRLGLVDIQAEALATLGILPNQPPENAQQALEQAVQLAESAGLLTVAARANLNLGGHLQGTGKFRASLVYLNRARQLAQRMGIVSWEFDFVSAILDTHLNLANLDEVENGLQTLRQLAVQIPNATSQLALIDIIEAGLWANRGEWPRAVELLEQARTNLNDSKDQDEWANANLHLGVAWMEMDRLAEAEESLVEAIRLAGGKKDEKNVYFQALFAALRLAQGKVVDASDLLQAARRSFETHPLPILDLNLLWFEGKLAAQQGRWEASQAAFLRATGLARDFGMRWSLARINLDWAEAYAARGEPGDSDQARELFQESLRLFEEIGSPGYIQKVKDRSKILA
jgi:tetratricopeptide (TPR) repeat protein